MDISIFKGEEMMEAVCPTAVLINAYQTTWCRIPEDCLLCTRCRGNLRSHKVQFQQLTELWLTAVRLICGLFCCVRISRLTSLRQESYKTTDNRCVAYFSASCVLRWFLTVNCRNPSLSLHLCHWNTRIIKTVGFWLHVYELLQQPPNKCLIGWSPTLLGL